jgi:hypothetical protein
MAVLSNSDSATGIRFVPLHHPNASRAFGSANELATEVVLRSAPAVSSATLP